MDLEYMDNQIKRFIEAYDDTSIGGYIKRWRVNTEDDDYDGIKEIYDDLEEQGLVE